MDLITLKGTPAEIGHQHGELLQGQVRRVWDFYSKTLFNGQLAQLEEYGYRFLEVIRTFRSDYATEIIALAEGAGLASWQIAALNARTEILHNLTDIDVGECTAMYFPGTRTLGQNWDWMQELEPLVVAMQIERADGHRILQMTEPGIIGKIGLNSNGIGACLNMIRGGARADAVPVHIMLRAILDADSIDGALNILGDAHGTCSNILMADDDGSVVDLELAERSSTTVDYAGEPPLHTNHYLSYLQEDADVSKHESFPNSTARFTRARVLIQQLDSGAGIEELQSILKDTEDSTYPICRDYRPSSGHLVGTVASVLMDLPRRALHVTRGNPGQNPYTRFSL
tara:strand:+ start:991 stop:2016 length:1026 start_codon:yes stop_codon:yes gene_type:complete